jgi:Holliday junction resolvase RusA-like endonuclease
VNAVTLPVPPSVNNIWRVAKIRNKARVVLSAAYAAWRDLAILLIRRDFGRVTQYPVQVTVTITRGAGWRAGRDLDNTIKPIIDALVKAGRLEDDDEDHVVRCVVELGARAAEACVHVCVEPVETASS